MLIFAVDDEPKMLRLLHRAIAKAEPDAEIMDFEDDELLIDAVTKQGKQPDVVFADIQLQGCSGLELAVRIKRFVPQTKIIFVTASSLRNRSGSVKSWTTFFRPKPSRNLRRSCASAASGIFRYTLTTSRFDSSGQKQRSCSPISSTAREPFAPAAKSSRRSGKAAQRAATQSSICAC